MKRIRTVFALAGLLVLLAVAVGSPDSETSQPNAGEEIKWGVASSGGTKSTSSDYIVTGTVTQTAIEKVTSDGGIVHQGYWQVFACCIGRVGDANGIGGDEPTIGDVSTMIDALFITGTCDGIIECLHEADINQSGGLHPACGDVTIGDISTLIDYLFITGPTLGLPDCP